MRRLPDTATAYYSTFVGASLDGSDYLAISGSFESDGGAGRRSANTKAWSPGASSGSDAPVQSASSSMIPVEVEFSQARAMRWACSRVKGARVFTGGHTFQHKPRHRKHALRARNLKPET